VPAKFVIGIDLGTTNCALACTEAHSLNDPVQQPTASLFEVPQLVNPGEIRSEPLLPSFGYLTGPGDFAAGATALPWNPEPSLVVGVLAQKRGVENARRLISSAKSWLSYAGVDRESGLLPVAAQEGVAKISPVEASRQYLEHLRLAWNHQHPEAPLEEQHVLVTVPASFDAVARDLTLRAAAEAGFRDVVLLEEPQAAFYAWIERHTDWRERVREGDLILVIDIGGGTTDFSLIAVTQEAGELKLDRVAVGEHILLGGDNMDLALARAVEAELAAKGTKLDTIQLFALWQNCRAAKEKMLEDGAGPKEQPVSILGRGSGVVGGTIRAKIRREDLDRVLVDGFLPQVASTEMPQERRRAGLAEVGLPYAADAAITRHLARFLRQRASAAEHGAVRRTRGGLTAPTHVLFNGGVFRATRLRDRLLEVLNGWLREEGVSEAQPLLGEDLMHAVARGAAYYGLARLGKGVRIRGGVPRTYYVGIETAMPAVPGMAAPLKALTVVPFGMEEGTELSFPDREFALAVGEPAEFRFFSSVRRKDDPAGSLIEEISDDFQELSPMEVTLSGTGGEREVVRVTLKTVVTETGVLQLWCEARDGRRWKLEFNVRERVGGGSEP